MPIHSMTGIGFGDGMANSNMILFTSGDNAPLTSKARNCYSTGYDTPKCDNTLSEDIFSSKAELDTEDPNWVIITAERKYNLGLKDTHEFKENETTPMIWAFKEECDDICMHDMMSMGKWSMLV